MKKLVWLLVLALALSCKKNDIENPHVPFMKYTDLNDQVISVGGRVILDINNDGMRDFRFSETEIASPPQQAMIHDFYVFTYEYAYTLTDADEFTSALQRGKVIKTAEPENLEWANVSQVSLVRNKKYNNGTNVWSGNWKNVQHKFLPIQITIDGKRHNGWVELSMDIEQQKLTLHQAAWSVLPGVDVLAGR